MLLILLALLLVLSIHWLGLTTTAIALGFVVSFIAGGVCTLSAHLAEAKVEVAPAAPIDLDLTDHFQAPVL